MATILISTTIFYGIIAVAFISTAALLGLLTFLKSHLPEAGTLLKASMKNRPVVQIHTNLGETLLYAPDREGKKSDGNMYDISRMGVKIIPNPEQVEHLGKRRHIHYYSKAGVGLSAKIAAACRDFNEIVASHGVTPNEDIVDALLIANDEEIAAWYPDQVEQFKNLKLELENAVIKDGQFVFQTVKDFVFAAQNETSRSLDEYKSIAKERAMEDAKLGIVNDKIMYIFYFVFLIIGAVIA